MRKYIDRAALFNSLSNAKTVEEIFAAIQAAPAEDVEPARHWIPVRWENLPEDENKVLCCTITKKGNKNIVIGYYSRELESWVCGMNSNVIAWMPLPELPGGEQNE